MNRFIYKQFDAKKYETNKEFKKRMKQWIEKEDKRKAGKNERFLEVLRKGEPIFLKKTNGINFESKKRAINFLLKNSDSRRIKIVKVNSKKKDYFIIGAWI